MPESTRRQIGKYQIRAELGRGGFGVVYSAYDPTVGRPVAVKVLTALGDNQLLTRFKNEAAAAGNLRHKNIVTIYDYGDDDGVPYIVMELLEGEDLNQIIAAGKPMSLLQKVSIMVQVADGLRSAHRAGVVHRDVKPGNIRLLPDGTVKLMDFGIARLVAGSAATRLTRQGHVIGTLYYMAPEQVMGEDVDALSDIFAYGSTYYELLTGKHPFQGSDPRSVFHKITAEDPEPVRNLIPECPEALERIVNRTLQKDRDLRYQSLRDVQVDTEPILIELRQERAAALVAEASRLHSSGDLDAAQAILGEVFDLDPANRDARQLRDAIQSKVLKRLIGPKIDGFVKKADDALSARRYEEAIESLEAAFRLDRTDQFVAGRLAHARELLLLSREMARLLANARRQFSKQDLEGALDTLLQVLERDRAHPEAQPLLEEVRTAISRRERERSFEEKLQQVRQLLAANSFDEAAQVLDKLDPEFRGRDEVTSLNAELRSRKDAFERQQYLSREIASARELLASGQFEGAIKRVELLMNRFPEEVEPTRLFILAHRELAAYRKTQALDKLDDELKRQLEGRHFERALALVSQSLKTYPAEPRLLETQRWIENEWDRHKRELVIRQLLSDAEQYSARNELEAAIQVLEGGLRQFPDELQFSDALNTTRDALAARRREGAILQQMRLAESQDYSAALDTLTRALAEYGSDDRLTALREKTLAAKLRDEAIRALVEGARAQLNERQYQPALDTLKRGLTEHGDDPRMIALREEVDREKLAWERATAISETVQQARNAITDQRFDAAIGLLESALQLHGHDSQLEEGLAFARTALAAKLRNDAIEALCREAQSLTEHGDFTRALQVVDEGSANFGDDARLTAVRGTVLVSQASEYARRHLSRNEPEQALSTLDSALAQYANEPALLELRAVAGAALAAKRREEAIVALHCRAQEQLQAGAFADAIDLLTRGLTEFEGDHRLLDLRARVEEAKAAWERTEGIRLLVAESHTLIAARAFEQAIKLLDSGVEHYGQEAQLTEALAGAHAGLSAKRRDEAIQQVIAQARQQFEPRGYDHALSMLNQAERHHGADPRLSATRDEVLAAKAEWERAEAIRRVAEEAQLDIAGQHFEKAIAVLESGIQRFGAEAQLTGALAAANAALERKRRHQAVDAACAEAQAQTQKHDFSSALQILDEAVAHHGQDERFTAARERVLSSQAEWKRMETIRQATEDSERHLAQGRPENALSSLDSALEQYAEEPKLLQLRARAEQALAAQRREAAILALRQRARAYTESGGFDQALDLLARGLTEFDGDTRLAELRTATELAKAEWERAEAIRHLAQESEALIAREEFEIAIALIESALTEYPAEPKLTQAMEKARSSLAARQRDEAIAAQLIEARAQSERREFQNALHLIDQCVSRQGEDTRLSTARNDILLAKANWERAEAIRELTEEARTFVAQQQFDRAIALLESGVKKYGAAPDVAEALDGARTAKAAKRRDEAIDWVCKQAQAQAEKHDFTRALKTLDRGAAEQGRDGRLAAMRGRVLAAEEEWERAWFIRSTLAESEKRLVQGKPELAVQALGAALTRYPADAQLVEALDNARKAHEAVRREEAVRSLLSQAESALFTRSWADSLDALERGLKAFGNDPRFVELRGKVLSAKAEWERAETLRHLVNDAHERILAQHPEGALELLESSGPQFDSEPLFEEALSDAREAIALKEREQAIESACRSAQSLLDQQQYDRALNLLDAEQTKDSRLDAMRDKIVKAKLEWEQSEAIRQVLAESRRLASENDFVAALEVLNGGLTRHPGRHELMQAVAEMQGALQAAQKETAIAALSRETRLFVGMQDFPTALAMVEEGLKTYGSDETRLADLRENVLASQAEWQRAEARRQTLHDAEQLIAAGTPERACRIIEQSLSLYPGDPVLLDAHDRALEAANLKRREEFIQRVLTEARVDLERGKHDLALHQIERALADHPDDRRLHELHQSALFSRAEAHRIAETIRSVIQSAEALSERGEREEAIAALEKALTEHPGNPELVGAIVGAIDAVGAAGTVAIDKICRNARQYMLTGNFDLAFHTIDQALRLHVDEQHTAAHEAPQKARTEAAKAATAGGSAAMRRESGHGASVKEETGDHALRDMRECTDEIPVLDEPVEPPHTSFDPAIVEEVVAPPPCVPGPHLHGTSFKRWTIGCAAALLLAAAVPIFYTNRTPRLATLSIRAFPPDATVRLSDQTCSAPSCEFQLKPGQYRMQVSAAGYRERTGTVTLRPGRVQPALDISLEPLIPTALVSANFADGEVTLDNHPAGRIKDGQLALNDLKPGQHRLQISSRDAQASVSFDIDYAKLPVFRDISQQNATLLASASFGNRAVVACSGCSGAVTIDERPAGEVTEGAIALDNIALGTHRVKVGSDRSLVFSATGAPGVTLVVTSDRNVGALIVETGEDNVTVYIDGIKYARLTSHGQLMIPAEAKPHTIQVAKEGYRAEPPEIRAQLTKGDQVQARFRLVPEPSRLIISHQLAGAEVLVDGSKAGTIAPDGTFSAQLPAGDHRIQFSKDGLTSAQVQRSFGPGRRVTLTQADAPLAAKVVAPPAVSGNSSQPPRPDPEEAAKRLKEVQQQQAAAARDQAWAATDQTSKASLEEFLSKYGDGSHARDARSLIGSIEAQQLKAAQEAQKANDLANRSAADANGIDTAIAQFEAAFNRRDLPGLHAIWTGMPKTSADIYRAEFRDAKSLEFHLTPIAQPKVNGDSASVICTRSQTFVAKNGQHPPATSERVRVDLVRAGPQWAIRKISPLGSE